MGIKKHRKQKFGSAALTWITIIDLLKLGMIGS